MTRFPPQLRQVAAEILAFDVLIDNADRRQEKPNILYKGDELLVIDHETTFAFTRLLGPAPGEWNADRLQFIYNHPFYPGLRRQPLDLGRFSSSLGRITDEDIEAICAIVPADFGTEHLERITEHLASARDQVGPMIDSIRRVMQ